MDGYSQVGPIDGHGSLKPGSMRLVTTGLRTSTALAEPLFAGQVSLKRLPLAQQEDAGQDSSRLQWIAEASALHPLVEQSSLDRAGCLARSVV